MATAKNTKTSKKTKGDAKGSTVITSTGEAWQDSPERVEVFRIVEPGPVNDDGSAGDLVTKVYDMPKKPNIGLALAYLKRARREGGELAMSWLMETVLGADAYDDLTEQDDLEPDDLKNIIATIQKIAMGGLETPKDD